MPLPAPVTDLIERFSRNLETYTADSYNETQLRREFLDPLFQSLGWDMTNIAGYADAYKDVIHEDSLKIPGAGGGTKAPDYCFRIGGTRKFFLEAKKPSVDIKSNGEPAYQLRRYAWSAKLPISVLSDFEEFAIYDTRIKPDQNDKASAARIFYCRYTDYPEKWDQIAAILSKDSILKGAFDKYAESNRSKRGTAQVDDAFLEEIEKWRNQLAANIALRNSTISERDLNVAVTKTIDRIVFLRICEDRGVEIYGQLQTIAQTNEIYGELLKLFRRADEKYNSGLFHFSREPDRPEEPDTLTPSLEIDDKSLRPILDSLYYPESPYVFSVLPADILGHVYEQFLGKVIRLTPGHRAKVEEKPEVRKAGGVYYTPTYIVNYIVENTVGKLLGDPLPPNPSSPNPSPGIAIPRPSLTPKEASKLKILDPACGSGSFLLGAYQYLLDWHLRYYASHNPEQYLKQKNPPIHQTTAKSENIAPGLPGVPATPTSNIAYKLTTTERKRILLNNIYGVDIDQNAVETTKLSLLLKVLEGESGESLANQMKLFRQRALPDLANNIKCGNSLIESDFYENEQLSLLDDEETRHKINAFNWNIEFQSIIKSGGFDVVIGNPPYVRQESLKDSKAYFEQHYEAYQSGADLYVYFVERGIKLLRREGLYGIIVSSSFFKTAFGTPLRSFLLKNACAVSAVDFGGISVFKDAKDVSVCIPILARSAQASTIRIAKLNSLDIEHFSSQVEQTAYSITSAQLQETAWDLGPTQVRELFAKIISRAVPLAEYVNKRLFVGLKTALNEAFEIDGKAAKKWIAEEPRCKSIIKPFLGGQDIRRYSIRNSDRFLIVMPDGWTSRSARNQFKEAAAWKWLTSNYAPVAHHLKAFETAGKKRQDKGEFWWELRSCDYYEDLDRPKIIYPDIAKHPRFHLDSDRYYIANTAYCIATDDKYLLGLLNSRIFWFTIGQISIPFGTRAGVFRYRLTYQYMSQVPIRQIDLSSPLGISKRDRVAKLVDAILSLHQQLAKAKTGREQIQRQIAATDQQIDALVYELYELTPEEIQLVESATAPRGEPPDSANTA